MGSLHYEPGHPPTEWLKKQLTFEEAEREQREEAEALNIKSLSSRWLVQWTEFKSNLQSDDQLWYFEHFPKAFAGVAGYCIIRQGVSVASITTKRG